MEVVRIKSLFLVLLFTVPVVGLSVEPVAEGDSAGRLEVDWPSFRGVGAKGVADGYGLPGAWNADPEKGEVTGILWRAEVPGLGHSSPVVSGNQVLIATAIAEKGDAPLQV